ncbi:hypothetical protein LTR84_000276 [Exophiala bonariae]|uniref:Uncharacterized protein n=1 Tax=Exophiala bonariae TaxID=1690606 RepID=A0AAV9NU50_9EURO|nr:hypothetical protein LTR84_000276 [Exophiala bonariae]
MIPWTTFGSTEYDPDWRIELNEYNLFHYVERGPTQLTRGLDSNMLEQAHERQFAISQLGLVSAGFEIEHTARIEHAIHTLLDYYTGHQDNETRLQPTSPHWEHLADFSSSRVSTSFEPLPPFDSEQSTTTLTATRAPPPTLTVETSPRSPLALIDLMNPEPVVDVKPLKRKYAGDHSPPVVDVDSADEVFDIENEKLLPRSLDYIRASRSSIPRLPRTHREPRMRRPSPVRITLPQHRKRPAYEAQNAETEAHLLLSFSHQYTRVVS